MIEIVRNFWLYVMDIFIYTIYVYMHLISYDIYSRYMLFGFIGLVFTKFDLLLTFLLGIMPKKNQTMSRAKSC